MTRVKLMVGLMVLGAAATGAFAEVPNFCPEMAISSVEQPNVVDNPKFSVVKTTDLKIHVTFPQGMTDEHIITLKFVTPKGHVYQQMDIPVSPDPVREGGSATRRIPGYPYPVEVAVPELSRIGTESVPAIEVGFPVGGTSIATSSLYGAWRIEPLVDGVLLRCFPPKNFGLVK